jgi:COMPASS component SWD3
VGGAASIAPFQVSDLLSSAKTLSPAHDDALSNPLLLGSDDADAVGDSDGRALYEKSALRAHAGAVYTAKFSPCGRLLASGALDAKVLLWDVTTKFNQQQLAALAHHTQLVIDVAWASDSAALASASYDHTVKRWDVAQSQLVHSAELPGLVQCVAFNLADNNQCFAGTSKGGVHLVDPRADDPAHAWRNDAMVNSLYVSPDGQYVITGDSKGLIKTWDVRMASCLDEITKENDPGRHAISHLHVSPPLGDDDGRFLAANSYDNILRVYDRRSKLISSAVGHDQDQMQLAFSVTGHKNKHWPIKSAFFRGDGAKYKLPAVATARHQRKLTDGDGDVDFQESEHAAAHETLLLATGSADNKIYLHDVSLKRANAKPAPFLIQKMDAHSDRVYCVDFHPTEPILASASADFSVKIWLPRQARLAKGKA